MFNLFQKDTPEQGKSQAKANYEKAAALKTATRESASVRVRIALLARAHLDSAFVEGAERTGTWQELCMLAIARGEEKPEPPTPTYFHRVKLQGNENYTYTWIPEDITDEAFAIGARYQTVQIDAMQSIHMMQRLADEICQKDLKLDAPFKALQFLRDELEAAGQVVSTSPSGSAEGDAPAEGAGGGASGSSGTSGTGSASGSAGGNPLGGTG